MGKMKRMKKKRDKIGKISENDIFKKIINMIEKFPQKKRET